MPSVQVMPTVLPVPRTMWATRRVVVVLPLTPVTATIGIRPSSPGGKRVSRIASATGRAGPSAGSRCIRRSGLGSTSSDDAPRLLQGSADVAGDDVDPGHVEADDANGLDGAGRDLGMDPPQRRGEVVAASGVSVGPGDRSAGSAAVAEDVRRVASGGRHDAVADDQQAEAVPRHLSLDQHAVLLAGGGLVRRDDLLAGLQAEGRVAAVIRCLGA